MHIHTCGAVGHWQGPTCLQQHPLSLRGTRRHSLWAECRAGARAHSRSRQLLAGHCLGCGCAAGTVRSGGTGRWLSPACFLRQPSLEDTSCLTLLLPGSPFICPACMAELLPSPLLHDLSACMEIPLRGGACILTLSVPHPVRAAISTSPSWQDQPPTPCLHCQLL